MLFHEGQTDWEESVQEPHPLGQQAVSEHSALPFSCVKQMEAEGEKNPRFGLEQVWAREASDTSN